jgi:hypothetical protein
LTVQISSGSTVQIFSRISRFRVSRLRGLGRQLPPCCGLPISEFPKFSRQSMGTDRRSRSLLVPTVLICSRFSRFRISRLWEIAAFKLWTPDSRDPDIFLRQIHGTRSTVQISSDTNGPDLFLLIVISHFAISRLWEIATVMLWTPDSRDPWDQNGFLWYQSGDPKIFSRQIHGTGSTVQISSGTNGPDLLSLITISHFTISRLWEIASFMRRTPDSRVPEIFSRQINGARSTVQNSFSTNGPDPLSLFMTSRL